jgi:N-acetylneuraminic acid mutarotase
LLIIAGGHPGRLFFPGQCSDRNYNRITPGRAGDGDRAGAHADRFEPSNRDPAGLPNTFPGGEARPSATPFSLENLPEGEWVRLARMAVSRSEMPAVVLDGLIYAPGGYGNGYEPFLSLAFEAYDPESNRWGRLADLPEGRHHLMAAAYQGRIYFFGGACNYQCQGDATAGWIYDPAEDAWSDTAPLPEERVAGSAVVLDDSIYVVGGQGSSSDLLRYDPQVESWERLAPLLEPREHVAAVALDGKIYAIGGRWEGELNSVEVYDPETGDWNLTRPMRTARGGHGAAVHDGKIFVGGGEVVQSSITFQLLEDMEIFDPATGAWSPGPDLPLGLHGFPLVDYDGVLFAIGGSGRAGDVGNQGLVWALNPGN